ncbi:MAG: polysaccharide deacetylase family protein [Bacteroidota bacterium]
MKGTFVISLDYELHWGFFDNLSLEESRTRLNRVNTVIDKLLKLSDEHDIKLTFATVGFLFAKNKEHALSFLPEAQPSYNDTSLDAYALLNTVTEDNSPYYFAYDTIQKIKSHGAHEIGTHTFSHYYCYEKGQDTNDFKADMSSAIQIAKDHNISTKSIVFPRNQTLEPYVDVCEALGIESYRGNNWYNFNNNSKQLSLIDYGRVALRVLDTYFNITGSNSYKLNNYNSKNSNIINIPASRFLRPYHNKLKFLEPLKVNRIKRAMTKAAKQGNTYHLWWHPHNFGEHMNENFDNLAQIFDHFSSLKRTHQFRSVTMSDLASEYKRE